MRARSAPSTAGEECPRRASGDGAGSCSRAPRDGQRCRARPQAPGTRLPQFLEVPLHVHGGVGEVLLALARRCIERSRRIFGPPHDLHALATAARGGLDDQRVAELLTERGDLVSRADRIDRTWDDRDARGGIAARAAVFEPISSIAADGGPIQTRPAPSTSRANAAFSARNPYPGWIASAPARAATSTTASPRR